MTNFAPLHNQLTGGSDLLEICKVRAFYLCRKSDAMMMFVPLVDNTTQGLGCYCPAAGLTNFTSNLAIYSAILFLLQLYHYTESALLFCHK